MNKSKKPTFKNPFDLDEEEEILEVETKTYQTKHQTVHQPLPFNPYEIDPQPQIKKNQKITKPKLPEYTPKPLQTKRINQPFESEQIPTRDYEPRSPAPQKVYELNEDGDPPLLQDIGIEPEMIKSRIIDILKLSKPTEQVIEDPDLSGPIIIALCFGMLLLLSGKIHFGDIYALFVFGNLLLYFLFNFMSQIDMIPLYSIMSTVGYALLPMLILSALSIFLTMKGTFGILLSLAAASWSSVAASNFVQALMRQTSTDRKPLFVYPLFLFYVSFALIIIF